MAGVEALPSCFNYFSKEKQKIYVTPLFDSDNRRCECVCPTNGTTAQPWQEFGDNASSYAGNTVLAVIGMVFLCALVRQSLVRTCTEAELETWREDFCSRDVRGKICTVLEILETKERDVRAAKQRMKCAEKQVRTMKLSTNQVHAAILCQMVKLREALDWVESNPCDVCEDSSITSCSSTNEKAMDTKAKIKLLENQINQLTLRNDKGYETNPCCKPCS